MASPEAVPGKLGEYTELSQSPDSRSAPSHDPAPPTADPVAVSEPTEAWTQDRGNSARGATGRRRGGVVIASLATVLVAVAVLAWSIGLVKAPQRLPGLRTEGETGVLVAAEEAAPFLEVPKGVCSEFGYEEIIGKAACEEAAVQLNLRSNKAAMMKVGQWPNGCNYFRNASQGGPDTLFINRNPGYAGDGKSTADLAQGGTRELICAFKATTTTAQPAQTQPPPPAGATEAPDSSGAEAAPKDATKAEGGATTNAEGAVDEKQGSAVSCAYVVGREGDNSCPEGSVPLIESECRTMPYHFGGVLHTPFEVESVIDPAGCFFYYPNYYYNTHPLGANRTERTPYCKRCSVTTEEDLEDTGDWTEWTTGQAPKKSSRYRKIPMGKCPDINWYPISGKDLCNAAAEELGLGDVEASVTMLVERPEGCYYFRNYQDGTGTLWLNANPSSKGNGAETSDLARGMLRQPICQKHQPSPSETNDADVDGGVVTVPESDTKQADGSVIPETTKFQKISQGTCGDVGAQAVTTQVGCEAAARSLGLVDTVVTFTDDLGRPEGCYYFRNYQDLTATLWLNTNPASKGKGAETSDDATGMFRQPICARDTSTVLATAKFQMISSGRCTDVGHTPIHDQATCEAAAADLSLLHAGALQDGTAIVAALTDSPEGCYYFWNSQDGTATLWLNTNADSVGAESSDPEKGLLRQPICIVNKEAQAASGSWTSPEEDDRPAIG